MLLTKQQFLHSLTAKENEKNVKNYFFSEMKCEKCGEFLVRLDSKKTENLFFEKFACGCLMISQNVFDLNGNYLYSERV